MISQDEYFDRSSQKRGKKLWGWRFPNGQNFRAYFCLKGSTEKKRVNPGQSGMTAKEHNLHI
ncbi:MAG: hypothetical protein BGN99_08450 [Alphaproteobacteria bacterium 65-37]|nr:MAG: hypothetical protein BGN99_08450 [Alphaproteobacteria bacterium 65-37]